MNEEMDVKKRVMMVMEHLTLEVQMLEMRNEIQNRVRKDLDKQQRDYFLHQQMRTIQDELGDNPQIQDVRDFEERAKSKKWDERVEKLFIKELEKLQRMNPQGAEYTVQMNYLDLLLDLPWGVYTNDKLDLKRAKKILERDHFGMEKVKERILEYLAVLKLKGNMKAPILCFYGPPGVGKTSLGKSIAEALGRKYVRMSLGGLHDEAEIRGHRKTYIGAMPGRIMQNLKKTETANPVFVLDEIDKLGRSNHGDPSSALLEVLDPEQNGNFYDNYVETEFDLSKVLFIATANNLQSIQGPLLDRMEIIEVNGYTLEEKIEIAIVVSGEDHHAVVFTDGRSALVVIIGRIEGKGKGLSFGEHAIRIPFGNHELLNAHRSDGAFLCLIISPGEKECIVVGCNCRQIFRICRGNTLNRFWVEWNGIHFHLGAE